jgi:hypothetical protein
MEASNPTTDNDAAPSSDTPTGNSSDEDYWKVVDLPSGRTAQIVEGTANTHFKAQKAAFNGGSMDPAEYQKVLMLQLVKIDGEHLSKGQLENLKMPEFFAIQSALDDLTGSPI